MLNHKARQTFNFKMAAENEPLLNKDVRITLKRDGAQRDAKLNIFIGQSNPVSPVHKKELHIRLTDQNDPFFLQFLYLGEDDFQTLKVQQGLLVDFSAFPQKFIDLIDLCSNEEKSANPRFLLQFTTSGSSVHSNGVLDVVETNPFKHLIHLSLKFLPGNDEEIKKYLARCLKTLKEDKGLLKEKLNKLENDYATSYSSLDQQLQERTKELENLKTEWTTRLNEASSKHLAQLSTAKEQELRLQTTLEERIKKERHEWEEKYHRAVSQLEQRNVEIDAINKDLMDKKYKSESVIRELKGRNSGLEEECRRMNKEVQTLRRQNSGLDSDRHERDKTLNHLRTRVAVLEQELKDKEQVILRSSESLESINEQKGRLDDDLRGKADQVNKLEATVRSVSNEVIKGNEIIHKLQTEIRNLKSQVKLKNIVTTKQEKIIEEKEEALNTHKRQLEELGIQLSAKDQEKSQLENAFEATKLKLEESQEVAKTNENVINWLNKQLNDQMLGPNRYTPHDTTTSTVNSLNSRISSVKSGQHHSTPSSGYLPSVPAPAGPNFPHQRPNQIMYRPPGPRRPPTWQSPPITASDGLTPQTFDPGMEKRQPLRQRIPSNQPIREQAEPVVDLKYLQKKPREPAQNQVQSHANSENMHAVNTFPGKRTVKPFPVSAASQMQPGGIAENS